MDITLKRILSLIPKKEDGKFKHGALSAFARKLGFKDGHIVSDWIAGNSTSYFNYLYQISALYSVSVEWLKGKTDIKNPDPLTEAGTVPPKEYAELNATNKAIVDRLIADLAKSQLENQPFGGSQA